MSARTNITIQASISAPIEKVWECFTTPAHVMQWNNASPDWHTPKAENDLQVGGKFSYTMAAKDGSFSFDFWGIYDIIETNKQISYTLGDERKVSIHFSESGDQTHITETFEAESMNSVEMQRMGWQAILDNFKKYVEALGK